MASGQPFQIVNGTRRNIRFPASSIEMSDGTTSQAATIAEHSSAIDDIIISILEG